MDTRIAVMADPELVDALRLAGIVTTRSLRATPGSAAVVSETLGQWLADASLGVIIIGTEHASLARELITVFRRRRRLSPVIVEVPSRSGDWESDAAAHYQRLGREFLGLEIVLQETPAPDAEASGAVQG